MSDEKELTLTWGQYFNFTEKEIRTATENVIVIKNKILQLHEKLQKYKKDFKEGQHEDEKKKIQSQIDRLEMSKECIKYYYKLEIIL